MKNLLRYCLHSFLFVVLALPHATGQVRIIPDKPDGIYRTGETVTWTVQLTGEKELDSLRYELIPGGLNIAERGLIHPADERAIIKYTFHAPGSVLLKVRWGKEDRFFNSAVGGAVADPDQLRLASPRPEDFDAFWTEKLAELAEVPFSERLTKGESGETGVDYYDINMDNIRGTRIHGQLARPTEGERFPALLVVQWAGVYPMHKSWAAGRAKQGWLVLNISAHDLPIHEDKEFYDGQINGDLKNYWAIGNENRETSYFLRMYLACYRAAEYLSRRADWDGKTLVVTGDSQGGQQAIMTAGLYPGITACLALVPAGFDMLGPEVGRKGGWPQWYEQTTGKDPQQVRETSRYFDVSNFVPNIQCPLLVGVGLLDETCPPEGILAGLNQYTGPKEIIILPNAGHQNRNGSQEPYHFRRDTVWLPALKAGKSMPDP